VRTLRTMTRDLEALRDWLQELGVSRGRHGGRPVYAVLEGHFDLIVGNARHIRNVPGRRTDVKGTKWIADLVRHGLIAKSFVPPTPQRELRELPRYRRKLVESQAAERNRLLKLLETANIKLASVASDVFGVSGRAMLKALIEGSASAEAMADLARGQLCRKRDDLVPALEGRVGGAPSFPTGDTTAPSRSGRAGYRRIRRPHRSKARTLPRSAHRANVDPWRRLGGRRHPHR
jgi:transposase